MLSINTNLGAFIVQSSLNISTSGLNQAIERMSTGFKINHAKDNAANYSIKTKLSSKISAYQVAEDNATMGLDMVSTASSSLDTMLNLLSRLRSLSVQAQNGTYGNTSLEALNDEAEAITDEIARIRMNTKYNGIELLAPKPQEAEIPYTYTPNSDGFLVDVVKRDTSAMTTLASVDETAALTAGTYSISTAEELAKLALMTNKGLVGENTEFVLANDIDLSGYSSVAGWTPIGNRYEKTFLAKFDGNGYVISNLYINSGKNYLGLFGKVEGSIENLGIVDAQVVCSSSVRDGMRGILAAMSKDVKNCYATGNIIGREYEYVGGLIGWSDSSSTVQDCWTDVRVEGLGTQTLLNYPGALGGICGLGANITRCFSLGDVYAPGLKAVGGIVGSWSINRMKISESYSTGDITGGRVVGGIVGEGDKILNCYSTGKISGEDYVGGLCAYAEAGANIVSSGSYGSVTGKSYVGALAGLIMSSSKDVIIEENVYTGQGLAPFGKLTINQDASVKVSIKNNIDLSKEIEMTEKVLQIGINSSESSTLKFSTGFSFNGLDTLLVKGLENPLTLEKIDDLIAKVYEKQTELGTVENRLDSALEQIGVAYDNLVSTQSTIRDTDIAEESSAYIRNQILQQAAATLMSTANQTPAIALQLL